MPTTVEQNIYNRLALAPTFHPSSTALIHNDWTIEPGDIVSVKSGTDTYSVPVYSMDLNWTGSNQDKSANASRIKISIESTGNEKREPLPELKRKQFAQGRYAYGLKGEIDEHWQHITQVTDQGMSDAFGIIGVSIGQDGMPVKDAQGNYVWDDTGTGGEIWGHLNRSAWTSVIQNHIQDANGRILSIGQVLTNADGQALITAINDSHTGTAQISADRIHIQSTSGSGISIDANGNISIDAVETANRVNSAGDTIFDTTGGTISLNGTVVAQSLDTDELNSKIGQIQTLNGIAASFTGNVSTTSAVLGADFYIKDSSPSGYTAGLSNAVRQITVNQNAPSGQIGITVTPFIGNAYNVNFNIAATQYYQDGVAAAYSTAVGLVSLPVAPRTQNSFSIAVPTTPWNAASQTGTGQSYIFTLGVGQFASNGTADVSLTMSHSENGYAITDGTVAYTQADASSVINAAYNAGWNNGVNNYSLLRYDTSQGRYVDFSGPTAYPLNAGDSITVYARFTDASGTAHYKSREITAQQSSSFDKANLQINLGSDTDEWSTTTSKRVGEVSGKIGVKYNGTNYGVLRTFSISAPKVNNVMHDSRVYASDLTVTLQYSNGTRVNITSQAR